MLCNYRWTGPNCTTDNLQNIPLILTSAIFLQGLFWFISIAFIIYGIKGIHNKVQTTSSSWLSLSYYSVYLCMLGMVLRIIFLVDPFHFFELSLMYYYGLFVMMNIFIASASILTYALWIDVISASRHVQIKRNVKSDFKKVKMVSIVACVVLILLMAFLFFVVVLALDNLKLYMRLLTGFVLLYSVVYIIIHLAFRKKIETTVKRATRKIQVVLLKILVINYPDQKKCGSPHIYRSILLTCHGTVLNDCRVYSSTFK
eukprot:TRINITY_DN1781_c0_g1_i1.p1 TRINITY_DN1781_c0_g1~~TRINITY_DN1781_c0_g1_i1.p1  ORF type:complete len:268 (-),score=8.99 TRINITY_DN1781_c0_g1_i1:177-950(-)